MRLPLMIAASLLLAAGAASAQSKPTQPLGPVPAGGTAPVKPSTSVDPQSDAASRGILYIPQFAPPGTQVPGGPPASQTPTLINPTVLGINR